MSRSIERVFEKYKVSTKKQDYFKFQKDDLDSILNNIEDIMDGRDFDNAQNQEGESFPLQIMRKLTNGINPIKVYREWRNMTQAELAQKVKSSTQYISQIETGKRTGSLDFLIGISTALGVNLEDITNWDKKVSSHKI